jgi:D-alanyl-D-alanine dipeptidase
MLHVLVRVMVVYGLIHMGLHGQGIESGQLIVVKAKDWSTSSGTLQRYEKKNNKFVTVGRTIEVKLGRNGLGWGIGLHTIPKEALFIKKEGDGKSPAGIFSLKQAFGYEKLAVRYPYHVYQPTDHCVDDVHSPLYNSIVDSTKVFRNYKSFEHMKFDKNYYKYGVVVNHNHIDEAGATKGAGSCIFLHIKTIPTAGCTVMREDEMKMVIRWLRAEANPLLVQGTPEVVERLLKQVR